MKNKKVSVDVGAIPKQTTDKVTDNINNAQAFSTENMIKAENENRQENVTE